MSSTVIREGRWGVTPNGINVCHAKRPARSHCTGLNKLENLEWFPCDWTLVFFFSIVQCFVSIWIFSHLKIYAMQSNVYLDFVAAFVVLFLLAFFLSLFMLDAPLLLAYFYTFILNKLPYENAKRSEEQSKQTDVLFG